jgi:hypothetical protein
VHDASNVMARAVALAVGLAAAFSGLTACASAPVIPLRGSIAELAPLAGEWDGTYASRDTGRSGSLWFKLVAGEDHAHGDVLMTPDGSRPYRRYPSEAPPGASEPDFPRSLTIRLVSTTGGEIDGRLDPYWDPACRCRADTAFRGRLAEGTLRGTFVTRFANGARAAGEWQAIRRPQAAGKTRTIAENFLIGELPGAPRPWLCGVSCIYSGTLVAVALTAA